MTFQREFHCRFFRLFFVGGLAAGLIVLALSPFLFVVELAQAASTRPVASAELVPRFMQIPSAITTTEPISESPSLLDLYSPPEGWQPEVNSSQPGMVENELGTMDGSLPFFSDAPVFSSVEVPNNTYSMDWGDYDRDGDLDLALGSLYGTFIYRNDEGQLVEHLTITDATTLGVRWGEFNPTFDGLELAAVGNGLENYIYVTIATPTPTPIRYYRESWRPLFRVEPGYFLLDDDIVDFAASSNSIHGLCNVWLYNISSFGPVSCVSQEQAAALSAADFNNDGNMDLALGLVQSKRIVVALNNGVTITTANSSDYEVVEVGLPSAPLDLAWGDYDRDGFLDLAAAFPLDQQVRIYHNEGGSSFSISQTIPADFPWHPRALDWADFDQDGWLDLMIADAPLKLYRYNQATHQFDLSETFPSIGTGRVWEIRGLDWDNDTDLDLALADQMMTNRVFQRNGAPLASRLTEVTSSPNTIFSVAWGDDNQDDFLDLYLATNSATQVYTYVKAIDNYSGTVTSVDRGFDIALGDLEGDFDLEVVGSAGINYLTDGDWSVGAGSTSRGVAWGYLETDAHLDLLIGNKSSINQIVAFANLVSSLDTIPIWSSTEGEVTLDIALADYNQDFYLDLAVANGTNGVRVYQNNKDKTFSPTQHFGGNAQSVDWADFDGDEDMDLAIGFYGASNQIYINQGGTFNLFGTVSAEASNTVSVAWGDWDNDGDFDLAIGNEGQKDEVYANIGTSSAPNFALLWESEEISSTKDIAWGDKDNDGDLDLAIGYDSGGGYYENVSTVPSRVVLPSLVKTHPYLSISRPGETADAYAFSSSEVLSSTSGVMINFTLYDGDGSRVAADTSGDLIADLIYEFSLDGGGTWTQTTNITPLTTYTETSRQGKSVSVVWDIFADEAVSDNALFRITVTPVDPFGPVQRSSYRAVSPPFRVRATTCGWPTNPDILVITDPPVVNEFTTLIGVVKGLSGGPNYVNFIWDFDDGETVTAQLVQKQFTTAGDHLVTLTVSGEPCPVTPDVVVEKVVNVQASASVANTVVGPYATYLPLLVKTGTNDLASKQVVGVQGSIQNQQTHLTWNPLPTDKSSIQGYRIYRGSYPVAEKVTQRLDVFQLIDTVPADSSSYTDLTATCGQMYYVTAFNTTGESLPSLASYFSPPCP